jgi:hypothetical protein
VSCSAREHADRPGLLLARRLNDAHGKQPSESRLARTAAPALALNVVLSAAAASSIARASSAGSDTDRFARCAVRPW